MQTENVRFLDLLGQQDVKFVVPAYQRMYAWGERECRELWLDVHRAAKAERSHFLGTFLYGVNEGAEDVARLAVVDGQQRLTTVTIMIIALARHLREAGIALDGGRPNDGQLNAVQFDAGRIDANLLEGRFLRVGAAGECKLTLSRTDRDTLFAVINGEPMLKDAAGRVTENLAYFEGLMAEAAFDAELLWAGLNRLVVIAAQVERHDPAQLIFESLNSKGLPLTTADLVRNYLLLAETHAEQTRLYDQYWEAIEGMFQPDPGSLRLDNGIQGWLSVRFRKVRAKGAGEVYSVFKQYVEDEYTGTTESLLRELRNFCLVWAENYRYHAVKKYRSSSAWAVNGTATLTSAYEKKAPSNQAYADRARKGLDEVDASL